MNHHACPTFGTRLLRQKNLTRLTPSRMASCLIQGEPSFDALLQSAIGEWPSVYSGLLPPTVVGIGLFTITIKQDGKE